MRTTQYEISLMKAKINVSQIEVRTKTRYRCAQLLFTTVLTTSFIALTTPAYCTNTRALRFVS